MLSLLTAPGERGGGGFRALLEAIISCLYYVHTIGSMLCRGVYADLMQPPNSTIDGISNTHHRRPRDLFRSTGIERPPSRPKRPRRLSPSQGRHRARLRNARPSSHLAALCNSNVQIWHILAPASRLGRLHLAHDVHAVGNAPKDDVLSVQKGCGHCRDEELRAVCVGTSVLGGGGGVSLAWGWLRLGWVIRLGRSGARRVPGGALRLGNKEGNVPPLTTSPRCRASA